jgi:hypothetical protein
MNTPPKLTDEQIEDVAYSATRRFPQLDVARAIEAARDQQWLDMLAAAPGVERIMELIDSIDDAANEWAGYVEVDTAPSTLSAHLSEHLAALRIAVEQALAARVPVITSAQEDAILETGLVNVPFGMTAADAARKVAEAMLAAAPQPKQQPAEWVEKITELADDYAVWMRDKGLGHPATTEARNALRTVIEQVLAARVPDEREAYIAWMTTAYPKTYDVAHAEHWWDNEHVSRLAWEARAKLAAPQPPQQPAEPPPECKTEAERKAYAFGWFKALESQRGKPAEWVGLTDNDLRELFTQDRAFSRLEKFARAIEARLREKNGGGK